MNPPKSQKVVLSFFFVAQSYLDGWISESEREWCRQHKVSKSCGVSFILASLEPCWGDDGDEEMKHQVRRTFLVLQK